MTDIAAACGVSQATVSLVLNNAPGTRISAATREAVIAKAQELGYARGGRPRSRVDGGCPYRMQRLEVADLTPSTSA